MQAAALAIGVNPLYAALPSYVIIMGGGAVVNITYRIIRLTMMPQLSLRCCPFAFPFRLQAPTRAAFLFRQYSIVLELRTS